MNYGQIESTQKKNTYITGSQLIDVGVPNDSFGEIISANYYYCIVGDTLIKLIAINSDMDAMQGFINHLKNHTK